MTDILNNFILMLSGVLTTVELMLVSVFFGFILAVILTFSKLLRGKWINKIIDAYIFVIRGTPLLVQLFLIYYGLGQFEFVRQSIFWPVLQQPFFCACLALILNTAAYSTVLLVGAIKSVPYGETLACYALGMTKFQSLRRIIFPQALRSVLPAYSNEVIMILQSTALASTVTLLDLMGITRQIIGQNYQNILYLSLAGLCYLILNLIIMSSFRLLERSNKIRHNNFLRI